MDILWKKSHLPVCILPYAVENNLFSVEKSTEYVDNPVDKDTKKRFSLGASSFIRKQKKAEILIKRISAF